MPKLQLGILAFSKLLVFEMLGWVLRFPNRSGSKHDKGRYLHKATALNAANALQGAASVGWKPTDPTQWIESKYPIHSSEYGVFNPCEVF